MVTLQIDLSDVLDETDEDDHVMIWAPAHREGSRGQLVTPRKRRISLEAGKATVEVEPGPLNVQIQAQSGRVDKDVRRLIVPEEGPVTLQKMMDDAGGFTYTPAVVGQVAQYRNEAAAAAARVEEVIDSTEWEGDQLRILGELSPPLTGPAPELTISPGGTWRVDGVDTGHPAQGDKGDTPLLEVSATGTWVIDGQDTGSPARGPEGYTPAVQGGTWHVGGVDTGYPASVGLVEDPNRPGLYIPETLDMSEAEVGVADVAGLSSALAGKSDVGHQHPVTDITATGTRSATTYLRGDGSWRTPTNTTYSVPTLAEAQAGTATTGRAFSAQRVAQAIDHRAAPKDHSHTPQEIGAAPAGHRHSYSEIDGTPEIPVTSHGYGVAHAEDGPTDYPAGVSYSMSNGVNQGWNDVIQSDVPGAVSSTFVMVLTMRNPDFVGSVVQQVYSYTDSEQPIYVRKWDQSADEWGAFRASTSDGHTHPVADIDATGTRGGTTYLRGDGTWATPTNTTYSVPTQAEAEAGTATTGRAFSAQRVAQAIAAQAAPRHVEVTGDQWPASGPPGTIYWQEEEED